jgi:hypothetical protein
VWDGASSFSVLRSFPQLFSSILSMVITILRPTTREVPSIPQYDQARDALWPSSGFVPDLPPSNLYYLPTYHRSSAVLYVVDWFSSSGKSRSHLCDCFVHASCKGNFKGFKKKHLTVYLFIISEGWKDRWEFIFQQLFQVRRKRFFQESFKGI